MKVVLCFGFLFIVFVAVLANPFAKILLGEASFDSPFQQNGEALQQTLNRQHLRNILKSNFDYGSFETEAAKFKNAMQALKTASAARVSGFGVDGKDAKTGETCCMDMHFENILASIFCAIIKCILSVVVPCLEKLENWCGYIPYGEECFYACCSIVESALELIKCLECNC